MRIRSIFYNLYPLIRFGVGKNANMTHIVVVHIRLRPGIPIPAEKFLELFRLVIAGFVPRNTGFLFKVNTTPI